MMHRTKYIIPFIYEQKNFNTTIETIEKTKEVKGFKINKKSFDLNKGDILSSVQNSLNDSDFNIGSRYQIDKNYLKKISIKTKDETVYHFEEMSLFVFRTGIGFISYELSSSFNSAKELIDFNYKFKEICETKYSVKIKSKEVNKDATSDKQFNETEINFDSLGRFITYLLKIIFEDINISFFNQRRADDSYQPDKALLFNGAIFEENEENDKFFEHIYHLTNGYKDSYLMPDSFNNEIKEIFKNTYIYATSSGFGYYAIKNEKNAKFYESGFLEGRIDQYLLFYIIVLFQYYSILNYSMKMSSILKSDSTKYISGNNSVDEEDELETRINLFLAKGIFPVVSTIEHHNVTYTYLFNKFSIQKQIDYLMIGFGSLKTISLKHKEEIESLEDNVREDLINISMAILSALLSLSFVNELPDLIAKIVQVFYQSFKMTDLCGNIITFVATVLIIIFIAYIYIPKVCQYRKNKKMLKELKTRK